MCWVRSARADLPETRDEGALERALRALRSGQWRRALVGAVPRPLRLSVAALIGLLDMIGGVGRGGERVQRAETSEPPALPPTARVLWKGASGRPFVVSDHEASGALADLRRRAWIRIGIGAVLALLALGEAFG
jgi:hypothetical protein